MWEVKREVGIIAIRKHRPQHSPQVIIVHHDWDHTCKNNAHDGHIGLLIICYSHAISETLIAKHNCNLESFIVVKVAEKYLKAQLDRRKERLEIGKEIRGWLVPLFKHFYSLIPSYFSVISQNPGAKNTASEMIKHEDMYAARRRYTFHTLREPTICKHSFKYCIIDKLIQMPTVIHCL